jgi:hypothetical protein
MKSLLIVNLIATLLLFVTVLAFGFTITARLFMLRLPETTEPISDPVAPPRGNERSQSPKVKAHLLILRGVKQDIMFPLYEGKNYLGRADEKPVDIDLEFLETPDRIWSNRQHAIITVEDGKLFIEDLKSSNGTFVNRVRVVPGQ